MHFGESSTRPSPSSGSHNTCCQPHHVPPACVHCHGHYSTHPQPSPAQTQHSSISAASPDIVTEQSVSSKDTRDLKDEMSAMKVEILQIKSKVDSLTPHPDANIPECSPSTPGPPSTPGSPSSACPSEQTLNKIHVSADVHQENGNTQDISIASVEEDIPEILINQNITNVPPLSTNPNISDPKN